jgi:hypothetical protein
LFDNGERNRINYINKFDTIQVKYLKPGNYYDKVKSKI